MQGQMLFINGYGKLLQFQILKFDTIRQESYWVTKNLLTIPQLRQAVRTGEIKEATVQDLFERLEGYPADGLNVFQQIDLIEDHVEYP